MKLNFGMRLKRLLVCVEKNSQSCLSWTAVFPKFRKIEIHEISFKRIYIVFISKRNELFI